MKLAHKHVLKQCKIEILQSTRNITEENVQLLNYSILDFVMVNYNFK